MSSIHDKNAGELIVRTFDQIQEKPVEWLWPGRIPFGMITILDGEPDKGKSLITIAIASSLTRGRAVYPGLPAATTGSVLFIDAEQDPARTIKPRLEAAGADVERCTLLDGRKNGSGVPMLIVLPRDIDSITAQIRSRGVRLVVVDPLMGFLDLDLNSNSEQSIRAMMLPLKAMAESTQTAIILVRHLNKKSGESAMNRGGGSIGINAASRSGLIVGKTANGFAMARTKGNLTKPVPAVTYSIVEAQNGHPMIVWGDEDARIIADDLAPGPIRRGKGQPRADAVAFLRTELAKGPVKRNCLMERGEALGFSQATIRRAAENTLRVVKKKSGLAGGWIWALPHEDVCEDAPAEDAHFPSRESELSIFEEAQL